MNRSYLSVLEALLSQPTAPFQEERIVAVVEAWARAHGLPVEKDASGNVLLRHRGKGDAPASRSKWVFAAHMDHPGFTSIECSGRNLLAEFRGHVGPSYFVGSPARFFAPEGQAVGVIRAAESVPDTPWLRCKIELDKPATVPPGTLGMWDLPTMEVNGQTLSSRACDDVVGVASVLCAMGEIVARGLSADVTALLTRAEEAGFVGALAACDARTIDEDALIVAIETSKAQPKAALGDGVVVRVGDAARTFEPSLTAHLTAVAESLARQDKDFKFTRQLMPGGTCESTAYVMYGYRATGLCIPLGNYHNQGEGSRPSSISGQGDLRGRIAVEQVNTADFESLVKLLVGLAADSRTPADTDAAAKQRLEGLLKQRAKYLKNPV